MSMTILVRKLGLSLLLPGFNTYSDSGETTPAVVVVEEGRVYKIFCHWFGRE